MVSCSMNISLLTTSSCLVSTALTSFYDFWGINQEDRKKMKMMKESMEKSHFPHWTWIGCALALLLFFHPLFNLVWALSILYVQFTCLDLLNFGCRLHHFPFGVYMWSPHRVCKFECVMVAISWICRGSFVLLLRKWRETWLKGVSLFSFFLFFFCIFLLFNLVPPWTYFFFNMCAQTVYYLWGLTARTQYLPPCF